MEIFALVGGITLFFKEIVEYMIKIFKSEKKDGLKMDNLSVHSILNKRNISIGTRNFH